MEFLGETQKGKWYIFMHLLLLGVHSLGKLQLQLRI